MYIKLNFKRGHSIVKMNLVIVESPAKCAKIAGFLGSGYKVIATMGHIRALQESLDAVGIQDDFQPKYEFLKEKAKAIKQIKEDGEKASRVYLCSDDDREGEMISYSVCLLLHLDPKTTYRAVFHEITKKAVIDAIAKPRTLQMDVVYAQQSRAMLDLMVGFTISRLLWGAVGPGLSAGRCQTPALRLVVDREKEIQNFSSQCTWKVQGSWQHKKETPWSAQMVDEFEDRDSAHNILTMHDKTEAIITDVETKGWSNQAPKPLITSTLQQQASSLFRSNPKNTMKVAQKLYEAGHITYMRTDKAVLGTEAVALTQAYVQETYGPEYLGKVKSSKQNPNVKAQEAHEAIRPTHMELEHLPPNEDWTPLEQKVYRLIWMRTIQSVMAAATGQTRTITFSVDAEFPWSASWKKTDFPGWKIVDTKETKLQEEDQEPDTEDPSGFAFAETLQENMILHWNSLHAHQHYDKAPGRYTEASLVKTLETKGIGRPSTFASLLSTIQDRAYVETKDFAGSSLKMESLHCKTPSMMPPQFETSAVKMGAEKNKLCPTPLGLSVLEYTLQHFQTLFDYNFTKQMEDRLDHIASGQEQWKQVLRDTWDSYKDSYHALLKDAKQKDPNNKRDFGNGLIGIQTKKGPLLLRESENGKKEDTIFYGWPINISYEALTPEKAHAFVNSKTEENVGSLLGMYEGSQVIRKKGPYGFYVTIQGKNVSCGEDETLESILEKFKEKESAVVKKIGKYEIRRGPYGLYMFQTSAKKKEFVSVSDSTDLSTLTEATAKDLFEKGLEAKKQKATWAKKNNFKNKK
jgi:DNA topoisomerase-1